MAEEREAFIPARRLDTKALHAEGFVAMWASDVRAGDWVAVEHGRFLVLRVRRDDTPSVLHDGATWHMVNLIVEDEHGIGGHQSFAVERPVWVRRSDG